MKFQLISVNFLKLFVLSLCLISSELVLAADQNKEPNKGSWQMSILGGSFEWKQGENLDVIGLSFGYRLPDFEYGSIALELGAIGSTGGGEITQPISGSSDDIDTSLKSISGSAVYRSKGSVFVMGKMGYAQRQFNFDFTDSSAEDSTSGFVSGAGVGLRLGSHAELELAYTSYEADQNLISLGLNWKFSSQNQSTATKESRKKNKPADEPKTKSDKKAKKNAEETTQETVSYESDEPMIIKRYTPSQLQENTPKQNTYKKDQALSHGRSTYSAEKAARIDGCRKPILQTRRNQWPYELYRAVCQNGSSRLISCEWGQCKIVK